MRRNTHSAYPTAEWSAGEVGVSSQTMADGKGGSSSAVLTGGLVEDVGQVVGDCFLAQPQLPGDLAVGQPFRYQA